MANTNTNKTQSVAPDVGTRLIWVKGHPRAMSTAGASLHNDEELMHLIDCSNLLAPGDTIVSAGYAGNSDGISVDPAGQILAGGTRIEFGCNNTTTPGSTEAQSKAVITLTTTGGETIQIPVTYRALVRRDMSIPIRGVVIDNDLP